MDTETTYHDGSINMASLSQYSTMATNVQSSSTHTAYRSRSPGSGTYSPGGGSFSAGRGKKAGGSSRTETYRDNRSVKSENFSLKSEKTASGAEHSSKQKKSSLNSSQVNNLFRNTPQ